MSALFGAIDLGASSGRVLAGLLREGKLTITEVHRFTNAPEQRGDLLVWNFDRLLTEVKRGIRELGAQGERWGCDVTSIGIDTWAVDYGLVRAGQLIAPPNCYRDPINQLGVEITHDRLPFEQIYAIAGLQFLPFNSVYQLMRQQALTPDLVDRAEYVLMLPDLIGYLLTGIAATERTNASSTGLLDAATHEWSSELTDRLEIDSGKFGPLRNAGDVLGGLRETFGPRLQQAKVVLVGSHDTASAVVGVPAQASNFAFLSSGTWSLLGSEIASPILTADAMAANFTNELGVDGRVRFLKNLSGLWLLNECLRYWSENGQPQDLRQLLIDAGGLAPVAQLEVADSDFIAPGDMPIKIARQLERADKLVPATPSEYVAVILHSLAASYAENLQLLQKLTGMNYDRLHLIGGGVQNQLLCQLTADYCGIEVIAGPVEATGIGNLLLQARTAGLIGDSLEDIRRVILDSDFELKTYLPSQSKARKTNG